MMHSLTYHPPAAGRETTRLVIITINDTGQKTTTTHDNNNNNNHNNSDHGCITLHQQNHKLLCQAVPSCTAGYSPHSDTDGSPFVQHCQCCTDHNTISGPVPTIPNMDRLSNCTHCIALLHPVVNLYHAVILLSHCHTVAKLYLYCIASTSTMKCIV